MGKPPQNPVRSRQAKKLEYQDSCDRNVVEGIFGTAKTAYGLARITARLQDTAFCVIGVALLLLNLSRSLRSALVLFASWLCSLLAGLAEYALVNFDSEWIDECVVQNYIGKVVTRTATEFEWYINLQGNAEQFMLENDDKRSSETYEDKARKTLELQARSCTLAFTFTINFDQARAFKKQFGKYLRANQWNDMTVKVYLR